MLFLALRSASLEPKLSCAALCFFEKPKLSCAVLCFFESQSSLALRSASF